MRSLITALSVTALLAASAGCPKSKDDNKSGAKTEPATKTPAAATAKTGPALPDKDKDKAKPKSGPGLVEGSLVESSKAIATEVLGKGKNLSEASLDEARTIGEKIVASSKDNTVAAAAKINVLVRKLAQDPDAKLSTGEKVARMVVLMVPLVGPTKRFIDARALYESGKKKKDDKRIQEARREALLAFVEAGLDIGTLGIVGGKIDLVATGFDKVLGLLAVSRKVTALVGSDSKLFERYLDKLLAVDSVRTAIDNALESGAQ